MGNEEDKPGKRENQCKGMLLSGHLCGHEGLDLAFQTSKKPSGMNLRMYPMASPSISQEKPRGLTSLLLRLYQCKH